MNQDAQGKKWYRLPRMVSGSKTELKTEEQASTEQELKDDPDAANALLLDIKDESWLQGCPKNGHQLMGGRRVSILWVRML